MLAISAVCSAHPASKGQNKMYGLISKVAAFPGKRDCLMRILIDGVSGMPGCLSYVVAKDASDDDCIWITEVWDSKESHQASLTIPAVQKAIALGRPFIAGFRERFVSEPIGGSGLLPTARAN